MVAITDRFRVQYAVERKRLSSSVAVYYVRSDINGGDPVARAVLHIDRATVSEVLVYRPQDRRRGIASALYAAIEAEIGRPLRAGNIRTVAGRAFWRGRTTKAAARVKRLGPMGREKRRNGCQQPFQPEQFQRATAAEEETVRDATRN